MNNNQYWCYLVASEECIMLAGGFIKAISTFKTLYSTGIFELGLFRSLSSIFMSILVNIASTASRDRRLAPR